jgi:hypothetical protein
MTDLPKIISVDDHVIEPANVWQDRLPKKFLEVGPRIVRAPASSGPNPGVRVIRAIRSTGGSTRTCAGR